MSRAGGLLLAIPQLAMDADVLIQAMQAEDADLVGPNKSLEAPLFEEEEGIVRKVKDACRFFLVDFSDEVLSMLRDFDASNDQVESLVPYDADHPYGIIGTDGLAEKARVWASGSSVAARAGFYSAREEPEEPALAAPKRPPKKLTNAMLLEKIEVLQAQVASLSVPPVVQGQAAPAIRVDEPPGGIALATPKIPALANGLRGPAGNEGIDIQWMLDNYRDCIDEINIVLCRFGRKLYEVGRPRNHYIETINGITALKPGLRRMVQEAWDLGFAWSKSEPSDQVLMALVATCFIWGWPVMAGCLSLMWGALLRPGELLATTRRELLLPKDVGSTIAFALV